MRTKPRKPGTRGVLLSISRKCAQLQLRCSLLPLLIAVCWIPAAAQPVAPQVINGQVTFGQQGNVFSITNTPGAIINWQSFSIKQGELVRFIQQSSGSSVLNRITGQDPSHILGALQSNGRVFLINPNGILFGRDARIDVNGLVASSLNVTNADFLAGRNKFSGALNAGKVSNQGTITTPTGGQVFLIAPNVDNSGIITSAKGEVVLAAGHSVELADSASPGMHVVVSAPADQAINLGQIIAQGGKIGIYAALVNQRGIVNANSAVVGENGKIILKSTRKTLLETGSVTTATGAGSGGEVQVLGEQVGLMDDARVDVSGQTGGGTVLIGGDYQGKNTSVMNAEQVYVSKDAKISADAIVRGDGGKVIVWGNQTAQVFGAISARGGALSGNGGFVETSGHFLDVAGIRVDAGAANGKNGKWLLDPYDIVIGAGGDDHPLEDRYTFDSEPATGETRINVGLFSLAMADVTLQATHDITFESAVVMAEGVGLTAQAGNDIHVNADITTNGGVLTLSANDNGGGTASGVGMVRRGVNVSLSTNDGDLILRDANTVPPLPSLSQCVASPALSGCSGVLPSLTACTASPASAGCSVVLPSLAQCVASPALSGCSAVLPALAACTANPASAGCSVVLPTLAQCVASPTLQGCSAVLPPVSVCVINPGAPGCVVVITPGPFAQALNTTVNLINTTTSTESSGSPTVTPRSPPPNMPVSGDPIDDKKTDDKQDSLAPTDTGAKKDEHIKKTYCN